MSNWGDDGIISTGGKGDLEEEGEERDPLTLGGNVNWCSHYAKQYGGSSKNYK